MIARNVNPGMLPGAAVLQSLAVVRAALNVWLQALPQGDTIGHHEVYPMQVGMRGIGELMTEVVAEVEALAGTAPKPMCMLYAEAFVRMVDQCLWNFSIDEQRQEPKMADLCAAIGQALKYMGDVERFVADCVEATSAEGEAA